MAKVMTKMVTGLFSNMVAGIKSFWASLDETTVVSKRELFLEIVATALGGLVLGMILTPKKSVTIGSHNSGNGCYCGNGSTPDEE